MASGINIAIDVDESGATKGITKVDEALEKVADSLDGVGKDGTSDLGKLETSIKDVSRESLKAGDDIKSGFGNKVKESAKDAEGGMEDFKSEANQTAKETAASFDGSAESIVDMFQETAANALSGFGPAGAIAGLALAAGIGIATAQFQQSEEAALKAKERISELGRAIVESGDVSASLDSVIENLKLIVTNAEDAPKKFEDIKKAAKDTGIEAAKLAAAYSGNKEALDAAVKTAQKAYEEEQKLVKVNGEYVDQVSEKEIAVGVLAQELVKLQAEQAAAAQIEKDWLASGGNELVARAEMVTAVNDSYDELAGSVEDFVNTETGLFDTAAYVKAMQEREQALKDYQSSITTSGLSPEAQKYLDGLGVEAASKMLAGYKSSEPATKKELDRIWKEASKEASGSIDTNLDGVIDKKRTAKIEASVDTEKAQADLDKITAARTALVKVKYVDRNGVPIPGLN